MAEKKPFRKKKAFEANPEHWALKWPDMFSEILEEQMKNFKNKLEVEDADKISM